MSALIGMQSRTRCRPGSSPQIDGTILLDRDGLIVQLDALSMAMEQPLAPKPVWTRGKMTAGKFEAISEIVASKSGPASRHLK